jgi:hypothetical protein
VSVSSPLPLLVKIHQPAREKPTTNHESEVRRSVSQGFTTSPSYEMDSVVSTAQDCAPPSRDPPTHVTPDPVAPHDVMSLVVEDDAVHRLHAQVDEVNDQEV